MPDTPTRDQIYEQIASDYLDRRRRGETPSMSVYCDRYPELADEIPQFLRTLELVEELPYRSDEPAPAEESPLPPRSRIGGYRILEEIGRGGMGIVYAAEQESLNRRVALKVLPHRWLKDDHALLRFQREAHATAKLHHTNIVPVFEVGEADGHVFYAMQLIQGSSLESVIREAQQSGAEKLPLRVATSANASSLQAGAIRKPSGFDSRGNPKSALSSGMLRLEHHRSVAQIGLQAADALSYAHERKIIHRDVKPSNLLIDESGVVWVTDFGIAKVDDTDLTRTGDLVGTLRYMSPERFQGECDQRSDIYALGLTLYELLVLRPAFPTEDRLALIHAINHAEPPKPRSLDPHIPRDLETIILKAIAKDPQRRYATATALAGDLRCFLEDRTIAARRPSRGEQLYRFCRRNKGLAFSMGMICLLVIALLIGSTAAAWYFRNQENVQRELTEEKEAESRRALAAEATMRDSLYRAEMNAAANALRGKGGIAAVARLTENWHPKHSGVDLRGWEWYYLKSLCGREAIQVKAHHGFAWSVHWHPNKRQFVSSGSDHTAAIWNADTGNQLLRIPLQGQVQSARWSPNGTRLAFGHGHDITVWDVEQNSEVVRVRNAHDDVVWKVEWAPDGKQLASVGEDSAIKTWDAATGDPIADLKAGVRGVVYALAWSPDGTMLATGGQDELIHLWDLKTARRVRTIERHPEAVRGLEFSPDGQQLASVSYDRTVALRNVVDGQNAFSMFAPSPVLSVVFSPDGTRLATGNWDGTVRLYDVGSRHEIKILYGHDRRIWDISWSPDGKSLASSSLDGVVRLWKITIPDEDVILSDRLMSDLNSVAWAPDSQRLAASSGNHLLIWDKLDQEPRRYEAKATSISKVRWSPDGKLIAVSGFQGPVQIRETETGKLRHEVGDERTGTQAVAWNPSGTELVIANGNQASLWNAESGQQIATLAEQPQLIYAVDWSPDGTRIATSGADAAIRVYSSRTRKLEFSLPNQSEGVNCIRWSPDGRTLACSSAEGLVRLWDPSTQQLRHLLRGHTRDVRSLCWNPSGTRLVSGGGDASLIVWDTETGTQLVDLPGHTVFIRSVDWSRNGLKIVSSSWDKTIRIWNATRGYQSSGL